MIAVAYDDDMGTPQYRTARAAAARFARLKEERIGSIKSPDYARMADQVQDNHTDAPQDRALEVIDEFRQLERVFLAAAHRGTRDFVVWARVHIAGDPIPTVCEDMQISRSTLYRCMNRAERNVVDCLVERDVLRGYAGRDLLHAGGPQARGVRIWHNPNAHTEEEDMRHTITAPVGPSGTDIAVEFQIRKLKDSRARVDADGNPVLGRDGEPVAARGERWEARCLTEDDDGNLLFKRLVYQSKERCVEGAQAMVDARAEELAD